MTPPRACARAMIRARNTVRRSIGIRPAQRDAVLASKAAYQKALTAKGYGAITTEIAEAGPFYFAETYHQQYLAKNPHGYCGIGGTGVVCSIGTGVGA